MAYSGEATAEAQIATLELIGIEVAKHGVRVLRGVDLSVADGELMAIIGPSGSGKTTLLNVAAGLDRPSAGTVWIDDVEVTHDPPVARNVAVVFQDSVIYPNRNVARNVSFPLEIQHRPRQEITKRVRAETRALHLEHLMERNPNELSAGHQQLVQIARALVRAPTAFLMDEPLARLDAHLRVEMRSELRMMQQGYGVTTLYVTNDPMEAMAMSDRLAVLTDGRIAQVGGPAEIYDHPATRVAAEITGDLSTTTFRLTAEGSGFWLDRSGHRVRVWAPALGRHVGEIVEVGFRPEHLEPGTHGLPVIVERVMNHGSHLITECRSGGDLLSVRTHDPFASPGDNATIEVRAGHVFDAGGLTVASW